MKNPELYIRFYFPFDTIKYHKGKVPRIRKAKRSEVPPMYRKNIWLIIRNTFSNNRKERIL